MLFTVALWLFSFLGTSAGLYFRGHYFILVLPAFALLLGMSVVALQSSWRPPALVDVFRSLPFIGYGLVVSWMFFYCAPIYFPSSRPPRPGSFFLRNPFPEAVVAAELVRDHSSANARLAVLGSEPEIYFYAHRHSATGYIYTYALMEPQPHALEMQQDMALEIETSRPEFLVQVPHYLSWLPKRGSPRYLTDWFEQYARDHYDRIGEVGVDADGKVVSSWGAATNLPPATSEYLTIFRRKQGQE